MTRTKASTPDKALHQGASDRGAARNFYFRDHTSRSRSFDTSHAPALATRERILGTAYELFSRRSIRDVGVNGLIETSGVAKSTFYRHFPALGRASVEYLARIRGHVQALAEDAGLEPCDLFARAWHLLLKGSIISTMEGDREATELAKQMAICLIERHSSGP